MVGSGKPDGVRCESHRTGFGRVDKSLPSPKAATSNIFRLSPIIPMIDSLPTSAIGNLFSRAHSQRNVFFSFLQHKAADAKKG